MLRSYRAALMFLTTLPVPPVNDWRSDDAAKSVSAYPFVGLTLGALLALAWWLLQPFPNLVAAGLLTGLWLLLTGALHLDGLCDVADAAFHPGDPARRLEIAKDPRLGTFALAAGGTLLFIKGATLAYIGGWRWLLLIPLLARTLVVLPLAFAHLNEQSSLGKNARPAADAALATLALGGLLTLALAPDVAAGLSLLFAVLTVVWLLSLWLERRLDGLNGDCFGALIEIAEVVGLVLLGVL